MIGGMTGRRFTIISVPLVIALIAACLFLMREQRLPPEPLIPSQFDILGDRHLLRPHIQRLLSQIESGKLLGAPAEPYMADLEKADRKLRAGNGKLTAYLFFARPDDAPLRRTTTLVIMVQDKFGHVVRCFAALPVDPK